MIFVLAALVGLAVALLRGVPLADLYARRFVGLWALALAAGLHVLLSPLVLPPAWAQRLASPVQAGLPPIGGLLYLLSLACALVFLALNRSQPGFWLIILGLGLNSLVIAANAGQMPADPVQLDRAGLLSGVTRDLANGLWAPFAIADGTTRLSWLGDVIYVPMPFREPNIISLGDLAICAGVLLFFNLSGSPGSRARFDGPRPLRYNGGR